ncbi:MAG: carotenoid oxygenase family protein, partial [Salinirussus sp.]
MHADAGLELGFRDVESEVSDRVLPLEGTIPDWLTGMFVRNGPGRFAVGDSRVDHWFDGLAMLQRFGFDGETVRYTNRLLRSEAYQRANKTGEIDGQFATGGGYLNRLWSLLRGQDTDNCNVHVARIAGDLIALTEVPTFRAIDPSTLETRGSFTFDDDLDGHLSMAHLVPDPHRSETIGLLTAFGRTSQYRLFRVPDGSRTRHEIASIPATKPAYIHSIAVAGDHIVLTEHPFRIDPVSFLTPGGDGFIDHVNWEPERGTRFYVIHRESGRIVATHEAAPLFVFHHVNAFETVADGQK